MNIQALPALVAEIGFVKCAQAVQMLYNTDLINESEARIILKRLRVMYLAQFNDASVLLACNSESNPQYSLDYASRSTAFKFKLA